MDGRTPYMTPREFARFVGLGETTVRRWIEDGVIPFRQPRGKGTRILIPADALERINAPVDAGAGDTSSDHKTSEEESNQLNQAGDESCLPGPRPRWMQ